MISRKYTFSEFLNIEQIMAAESALSTNGVAQRTIVYIDRVCLNALLQIAVFSTVPTLEPIKKIGISIKLFTFDEFPDVHPHVNGCSGNSEISFP